MLRFYFLTISFLVLISCSTDAINEDFNTLDNSLASKEVVLDNVIACAASNATDDKVSVFFYPRPGATNIQYFETESSNDDKNNFDNYVPVVAPLKNVFNGYLQKFEVLVTQEKWAVVTFDEGGQTHLSNPIRIKHQTKPTEYLPQNITIDATSNMPRFSWRDGRYDDTKIYFQVVSDNQDNLVSGTYTFEKTFQFYNLDNVVLNITKGIPSPLQAGNSYGITLMAVSEDNWVNMIVQEQFSAN